MVVSLSCNLDQLQEAFLERLGAEFDRAEDDVWAAVSSAASAKLVLELRWLVVDEVAALPVAVEHGTELGDDVGVPGCSDPHVPLQPRHLRGVRQVRRPDVGGREPRATVEHPRLRMETRGAHVVGDAYIGAEARELIEGPALGRARVRSGEHPQRLPGFAVPSECLGQRVDATAADECHDQVDLVGRLDLGSELVDQVGLSRRARQQCRVEQRDERLADRLGRTIGTFAEDRMEDGCRIHRERRPIDLDQLAEPVEQRPSHPKPDLDPIVVSDVAERRVDLAAQVPSDPIRGLGRAERALLYRQLVRERVELCLQPLRDERLVQSRAQLIHAGKLRAERDAVVGTGLTPAARAREGSTGGTRR